MVEFEVNIKGLDRVYSNIANAMNHLDRSGSKLHNLGEDVVELARSNLQNNTNVNSGTLLSSIQILSETNDSIFVGSPLPYAGFIEYGRGPVYPINSKFLHWVDKTTGKDVYATHANATEPMPFMMPALVEKTKNYPGVVVEEYKEIFDST